MAAETSEPNTNTLDSGLGRAVIDTSAPFESVKEAANRFGGMGFWKPVSHNASEHDGEAVSVVEVEEQAAQLERETLDVLKELEATKTTIGEVKLKLEKEASEIEDNENHPSGSDGLDLSPEAPQFILLELKQAKLNLTKTTNDLADIRSAVDTYKKKIDKERRSLEKTRQRLSSSNSKVSCPEVAEVQDGSNDPSNITRELQKLSSEAEQFKKVGEAAKAKVLRAVSEIKQTKTRIRTAEIRLVAAKKMKEAAKASEALALAEIKALSNTENKVADSQQKAADIVLSFEEYSSLISRAQAEEKGGKDRAVDEANLLKTEILKKVEQATAEVRTSKRALEEALSQVEAANGSKLAVEEALRVWRSKRGHKCRPLQSSTKFTNSHPSVHQKESCLFEVNGLNLENGVELKPVLKPSLSIGQILSRKLLLTDDYENGLRKEKTVCNRKISLGQMLNKRSFELRSAKPGKENNELPAKRKKFGFARISLLVAQQSKKKKNLISRSMPMPHYCT